MILNPKEAKTKWCPMASGGRGCIGGECMAWRWVRTPQLEARTHINIDNAERFGIQLPSQPHHDPELADYPAGSPEKDRAWDAYWEAAAKAMAAWDRERFPHPAGDGWTLVGERFPRPPGDGWALVGEPEFWEQDDEVGPHWAFHWTRDEDPLACGFCGLAGKVKK